MSADDTALTVPTPSKTLVALAPQDVPAAQQEIAQWCDLKIRDLNTERSDLLDNALVAQTHGWAHQSLTAAARKKAKAIEYYQKIKAAVEAGYLIVPNFRIEVMAVRVGSRNPDRGDTHKAYPHVLPAGEGRYVDQKPFIETRSRTKTDAQGNYIPDGQGGWKRESYQIATDYDDVVDFPVLAVKPIIMDATARAMSLKIFDQIGVVVDQKQDPVVVGQIVDPRSGSKRWPKTVSFFIAWWLDTRSL